MTTECGVCHEEYADSDERKPKLLPCSHTVCISCLNLLVDDEEQVQSPECRNVSDLPEDGPDAYKTNRYILEFMELVRKMKRVIQGLITGNTAYTKRTMNKRRTKKVIRITSLVSLVQDNFQMEAGSPKLTIKGAGTVMHATVRDVTNMLIILPCVYLGNGSISVGLHFYKQKVYHSKICKTT